MTVYVLRKKNDESFFKIGKSKTPTARAKALRAASPDLYVWRELTAFDSSFDNELEKFLHHAFAEFQVGNGGGAKECFRFNHSGYIFEMPADYAMDTSEAVDFQLQLHLNRYCSEFDDYVGYLEASKEYQKVDDTTKLYPEVEPTEDIKFVFFEYVEMKKAAEELAYKASVYEAQLKQFIGDTAGIKGLVSWPVTKSNRVDTTSLKAVYPELVEQFTRPTYTRTFRRVS